MTSAPEDRASIFERFKRGRGLESAGHEGLGLGLALCRENAILMGGAVVTESVYGLPGLGRLTVEAVLSRDFPTIQTVILMFSVVYVVINLLIDISYTVFDPRIRY